MRAPLDIVAHNGAPEFGGAEIATCILLAGLQGRGHRVTLYCNRDFVAERAAGYGLDARVLRLGGDALLPHALRFAWVLRRRSPDALLLGTFRKLWLGALAGRLARVPRIVARIGLSTDVPRNAKYRFVFRRWIDAVGVNAEDLRQAYRDAAPGLWPDRIVTIHKGVPPLPRSGPRGALRAELGIPADAPVVGAVARLVRQKRLERLVRALAQLPGDTHCIIAGAGPERESLESLARELGVHSRVHLPGWREDVGTVLDALDVFVLCSDRESMANAMLEAMSAGVPVVSTPVSGAAEALAPDGAAPGIVVDFEVDAIADAVRRLLADAGVRRAMGDAGRRRVRERFTLDRMLDRWEALLAGEPGAGAEGTGTSGAGASSEAARDAGSDVGGGGSAGERRPRAAAHDRPRTGTRAG